MSQVIVDFETLKFNLYDIIGVETDASESKIKKSFKNLILNFHPDKKNDNEEDIYYHIITANQILSNKDNRKKYDTFLNKAEETHDQLKDKYNKNINTKVNTLENKDDALKNFTNKFKELEKKHLVKLNYDDKNDYEKILKTRETEINIINEDIKTPLEFNQKFEDKVNSGGFFITDQLVPVTENMSLSSYNVNDNYTSLDIAFDNLYVDGGGISTSKFSSLDAAFKIQPTNKNYNKKENIKQSMDDYNAVTSNLADIKYSKDKFELW
jgi:DnaJ-class molecular chaperone